MNLKENKKTLFVNMGNNVKGSKLNPSKRYPATENSATEIDNSIDSNNFNFSRDNRKSMSFYSNNDYIDIDKEPKNEEISRFFKTEALSLKNNLEEIRSRNFKSIECSNSRRKRIESIKEIEKKLDDINAQHNNQINPNINKISVSNNFNYTDLRVNADENTNNNNNNQNNNHHGDFNKRKTTTMFFKNPVNNNELNQKNFDRRITFDFQRNSNDTNNANANINSNNIDSNYNNNKFGSMNNYSKNKQVNLQDKYTDNFIDYNKLTSSRQEDYAKELNIENNRDNTNPNKNDNLNNNNINNNNYRSIGFRELPNNTKNNYTTNQNNLSDLKSLIQQSVENVNDMNRRFTQLNNLNQPNNADFAVNRRSSKNSHYQSNPSQIPAYNRVHSHSVTPTNKISNLNFNLNQNKNINFNNILNLKSIEKDVSIINSSLNNSNMNKIDYNYPNNKNSNILNNLTDSFSFNNVKNEEININNYPSTNNSLITDYFDNNFNQNNSENIKSSNKSLVRRNVFEEESNKRENATTMSLTQKINRIKAERELSQDCRTPEPRRLSSVYDNNYKNLNSNNSLNNNINNFSSDKKNNLNSNNEKDYNRNSNSNDNAFRSEEKANNPNLNLINNNNNNKINKNNQLNNLNPTYKVNADNNKFISDSRNFEIIYEKEEEGISKNPSALYDFGKQASHEEIRESVSNFPENKRIETPNNNKICVENTVEKNKNLNLNAININNKTMEDPSSDITTRLSRNSALTNQNNTKNEANQIIKNSYTTQGTS